MASFSSLRSIPRINPIIEPDDLDPETSKLIAELLLEDLAEIGRGRKGKARADAPLSDQELALKLQSEYWEHNLRTSNDYAMAKSLNDAINTDNRLLNAFSIVERAAADDRRAALTLLNGGALPPLSEAQRLVEDPTFSQLAETSNEDSLDRADGDSQDDAIENLTSSIRSLALSSKPSVSKGKGRVVAVQPIKKPLQVQTSVTCTACGDTFRSSAALKVPCEHFYCGGCLSDLISAATRDESLYPPRCCSKPIPHDAMVPFIAPRILQVYNAKRGELNVPAANRVYCPAPACSAFLGSSEGAQHSMSCGKCGTSICPKCRQVGHPGQRCTESQAVKQVRELAQAEQWQTCPGCHSIVELHTGCYHMTCRCRFEFCYVCAVPWKNCKCPQWDEGRLLETARHRVEVAVERAPVAPIVFRERIRQMANTLRDNHNCIHHSWRRQNGSANCEECGNWLRDYLLACRNCHLMACVRCARNRLA